MVYKMLTFLKKHIVTILLLLLAICMVCFIYKQQKEIDEVTFMTQQQAETTEGIRKAAEKANTKLDYGQEREIVSTIKEIHTTEQVPVYVVKTAGNKLDEASEEARLKAGADFSIITGDAKQKQESASAPAEIADSASVTLNQYNIKAYKKQLNTIEYQPWEKTIGYTHSWKIDKSGKYLGIGADYDIDDRRVLAKVTYSW